MPAGSRGGLLIGLIVLITAVILALSGATWFLTEHLRVTSLQQNRTKAIYLAQAGVMQAVYQFRFNDPAVGGTDIGFLLGEYPVPSDTGVLGSYADDDVFILGGVAADFLLATMIPATWATAGICGGASTRQRLQNWTLRNVLLTSSTAPTPPDNLPDGLPVVIDRLEIEWQPNNGELVYRVDLMGTGADYSNCAGTPSGGSIDVNQTIAPNTQGSNRIWFSRRTTDAPAGSPLLMNNKDWIEVRFFMTDVPPSVRRVRFIPGSPTTSSASFTVKSVGEVRRGQLPFLTWRRLQAEYRLNDDDATIGFQEMGNLTSDPSPATLRPGFHELTQRQP